jgi:hypothetical protein
MVLGFEKPMAHLSRNVPYIVVVIAEAEMHRHLKCVGDGLDVVEPCGVLEVEVVVGGGIVVEVVPDEEDLLNSAGLSELIKLRAEMSRGVVSRCFRCLPRHSRCP